MPRLGYDATPMSFQVRSEKDRRCSPFVAGNPRSLQRSDKARKTQVLLEGKQLGRKSPQRSLIRRHIFYPSAAAFPASTTVGSEERPTLSQPPRQQLRLRLRQEQVQRRVRLAMSSSPISAIVGRFSPRAESVRGRPATWSSGKTKKPPREPPSRKAGRRTGMRQRGGSGKEGPAGIP